jgi:ribosomal protein S18 acetylase RimI-like enzyme
MTRTEINLAIDWAAAEGWNPGLYDAECFYATDHDGFFVGKLDGEPVACISAVAYDKSFGFIGFYIVKPEFRGNGFGIRMWNTAIEYMGDRNIGLDGVVTQQENYKKSGFQLAYRNIRYTGLADGVIPQGVVDLSEVSFRDLVEYDSTMFPAPRPQFLRRWIEQPNGLALGIFKDSRVAGYGVLRSCRSGFKIGPLFADDEKIAEDLFQAFAGHVPGASIFLDIPETNPAAIALVTRHSMRRVFETARMYTKGAPYFPLSRMFGVTTFELG